MIKLYNTLNSLVSVIIPVLYAENTLHIAMDSLLGQSYQPIELVVVYDCSKWNP